MPERKSEWAIELSNNLKRWMPVNEYRTSIKLADELSIPRDIFNRIHRGFSIAREQNYYARLNLWTDLVEADPRSIPDTYKKMPNGSIVSVPRRWSEDEYQQWLEGPEAQELLIRKNERFKREILMETTINDQQTEAPQNEKQTVGSVVGSFIDHLINNTTKQVATQLLQSQKEHGLTQISEQMTGLEKKIISLESVVIKLIQAQVERSTSKTSKINNISQLASNLKALLDEYKMGTNDDRNKLMQQYGTDLMALDIIVHTLTRRPLEREEAIKLAEETKL
ncbi:MAG: hypothetical protein V1808_00385 [Candidatus Daviesbacteria bacterium]